MYPLNSGSDGFLMLHLLQQQANKQEASNVDQTEAVQLPTLMSFLPALKPLASELNMRSLHAPVVVGFQIGAVSIEWPKMYPLRVQYM